MQAQLHHLLVDAESPHVTVQVLPFKAGAPASSLPFNVLSQDDGQSVLYSESRGQGHVTDSATAVAEAQATYDRLRAAALSSEDSLTLIREAMEAHTS
jgi:hypothetical protein